MFLSRYRVWAEFESHGSGHLERIFYLGKKGREGAEIFAAAKSSCEAKPTAKPTRAELQACSANIGKLQEWITEALSGKAAWEKAPDTNKVHAWIREQRKTTFFDYGNVPAVWKT